MEGRRGGGQTEEVDKGKDSESVIGWKVEKEGAFGGKRDFMHTK